MRTVIGRWLVLLPALCLGCASDAPPPADGAVQLGAWDDGFVPLWPGDPVQIEQGSQGGYHVRLAARTKEGRPSDELAVTVDVVAHPRQPLTTARFLRQLPPPEPDGFMVVGDLLVMLPVSAVRGVDVDLDARLVADAHAQWGRLQVELVPPE